MLVPMQWLRDYVDADAELETFCEKMILSGSNIEHTERFGENIEKVVVGKITATEKHPDAEKLLVCTVDVGRGAPVQIVTGAPNVAAGIFVPVALHGSRIPGPLHGKPKQAGGVKIQKGKLRGVESAGILCAASELGFADKVVPLAHRDGIWILEGDYRPGEDIVSALGLAAQTVSFEITPNRPDCLSMIGMAREAGAVFHKQIRHPETQCEREEGAAADFIAVDVRRKDLCKRYVARVVKDVKIAQSPWWLQKRLIFAGMRPINNIVDVTNFVMLEYGQPIHAFDIRQIEGNKIIVDGAKEGERLTTLDGVDRVLAADMTLIKDGRKAIGLAGVMGGLNSEVKDDTQTIVIEAATFNGNNVRMTSNKLSLRTEASARFEKGIDPNLCAEAANRVCKLIEELGAGTVVGGSIDVYEDPEPPRRIAVRVSRMNQILGTALPGADMKAMLNRLEMQVEDGDGVLWVTPPTVRQDLAEEIDFTEEIARLYGYDKLPATIPKGNNAAGKSKERQYKDLAKDVLCALGAHEAQTYSFVSPKGAGGAEREDAENLVRILNPLGEETSVMRSGLRPNLLEVLGRNYSRNIPHACFFELGAAFAAGGSKEAGLPLERDELVIGTYGPEETFFSMKGMAEELLAAFGIDQAAYEPEKGHSAYHPGRCARIVVCGEPVGVVGQVHPDGAALYGIGVNCYCCELLFDRIMAAACVEKRYKPLPKYPPVPRDVALIVREETSVGAVREIIKQAGADLLESAELFDVYRGKQVEAGHKSLAFALVYRAADRTLTDEEVGKAHERIVEALAQKTGATLREE